MNHKEYTDDELFEMIESGGVQRESAIRYLMKEELRVHRLDAHLRKLGAKSEEREEVIDDTLIALIIAVERGKFEKGRSIWNYLYSVARNIFLKQRRDNRLHLTSFDAAIHHSVSEEHIEAKMINNEKNEWLLNAIGQLAEKCRKILRLSIYQELSNQRIAEQLGYKSKAVVSVKRSECMKKLAKYIKGNPF